MTKRGSRLGAVLLALMVLAVFVSPDGALPLTVKGKSTPQPLPAVLVFLSVLLAWSAMRAAPAFVPPTLTRDLVEREGVRRC